MKLVGWLMIGVPLVGFSGWYIIKKIIVFFSDMPTTEQFVSAGIAIYFLVAIVLVTISDIRE